MPPRFKFTRDEIINAALDIARAEGLDAVTARALGAKLGSSSKPVFSLFQNMDEVQKEVIKAAKAVYGQYLKQDAAAGAYPVYKASGIAYIRFAREEKELFKLLFMRDRSKEAILDNPDEVAPFIKLVQEKMGISQEKAYMFHLEMWVYVHGIATMSATNYLEWEPERISAMLTDVFEGLKHRYLAAEGTAASGREG